LKGTTLEERLKEINSVSDDIRPLARVRAIRASPNREKEHLVTLMPMEKDLHSLEDVENYQKQSKKKALGFCAAPITKKLPWMSLTEFPEEFKEDLKNNKKPQ
jgi:hypothetical protein